MTARETQYRFVYINKDGSVRELLPDERDYLETPFEGSDGARPYIKLKYDQKNGWGEMEGFCLRSMIPKNLTVQNRPSS